MLKGQDGEAKRGTRDNYSQLCVLLIAGPSGSGKSTFIDALRSDQLPLQLRNSFPVDVASWPAFEANDVLKRGDNYQKLHPDLFEKRGVILHYDTFFIHRAGLSSYAEDPIWPIITTAAKLYVVSIEPTASQLQDQFFERFHLHMKSKGVMRSAWHRLVKRRMRQLNYKLFRKGMPDSASLYKSTDTIESWQGRWEQALSSLTFIKAENRLVRIKPCRDQDGQNTYVMK